MHHPPIARSPSFLAKTAGAAALVALADLLFYGEEPGATLGVFALAWAGVLVAVTLPQRRRPGGWIAVGAAASFALVLVDDPNPLAVLLFLVAIGSAALLSRARFDDAAHWAGRLVTLGVAGLVAPIRDLRRLRRLSPHPGGRIGATASLLALPLIGGAVFVALFAGANPLIGNALAAIRLPDLSGVLLHLVFWSFVLLLVWPSLRPRTFRIPLQAGDGAIGPILPTVPLATLVLSLVTFNLIFAVQNALDLAFLWSGAALPAGMTMTEYVHRGAYPLIMTALLAGGFVLATSRPGSAAAASPTVRRLVTIWVAQNMLLVASSVLRTLDYIAASMLTVWRISALAWMALVAVGLVLICWRMLAGRSAAWLVNANAAAAALVLAAASVVDLGAVAAAWNVRHARAGDDLDLCYLHDLGPSALLPLVELERRAGGPRLRDRAGTLRQRAMARLASEQADWHSWSWRGARRLAAAQAALGPTPRQPLPAPDGRRCDGSIVAPPPAPALTQGPQR